MGRQRAAKAARTKSSKGSPVAAANKKNPRDRLDGDLLGKHQPVTLSSEILTISTTRGQRRTGSVTITATRSCRLRLRVDGEDFAILSPAPAAGIPLEAADAYTATILFSPRASGRAEGALELVSTASVSPTLTMDTRSRVVLKGVVKELPSKRAHKAPQSKGPNRAPTQKPNVKDSPTESKKPKDAAPTAGLDATTDNRAPSQGDAGPSVVSRDKLDTTPVPTGLFGLRPDKLDPNRIKIVGEQISATTPAGNENSIAGQMASVRAMWGEVVDRQIAGVNDFADQALATTPSGKSSTWWKQALRFALGLAIPRVTGQLLSRVTSGLEAYIEHASGSSENSPLVSALHTAAASKFRKDMDSRLAAGLTNELRSIGDKMSNDAASLRAVIGRVTNRLSFKKADLVTAFNNHEGDFEALEAANKGAGFLALEGYRNALANEFSDARRAQQIETMSAWMTGVARQSLAGGTAHHGIIDEDPKKGTDLTLPGGISTDETARGVIRPREQWAEGLMVIDMDWMTMRPRNARVRGVSDQLKAELGRIPLGQLAIPIVARGNVRGDHRPNQPGELRVTRNEQGAIDALIIETDTGDALNGDLLPDRQVARFIRRVLHGERGEGQIHEPPSATKPRDPLPSRPEEQLAAAKKIFEALANLRLGKIS